MAQDAAGKRDGAGIAQRHATLPRTHIPIQSITFTHRSDAQGLGSIEMDSLDVCWARRRFYGQRVHEHIAFCASWWAVGRVSPWES